LDREPHKKEELMRQASGMKIGVLAGMVVLAVTFGLLGSTPAAANGDGGVLLGCTSDGQLFYIVQFVTGEGEWVYDLPTAGYDGSGDGATEIEFDNLTGNAWVQGSDGSFIDQGFNICNGAPTTDPVYNDYAFNGLEFVGPVLYGTGITDACGPSELRILDPFTGASTLVGPTGMGPISGLAWDPVNEIMYGTTGCAGGAPTNFVIHSSQQEISLLVTIDLTTGLATPVGPTDLAEGTALGGLEFGPDGNLYGGGNNRDGGNMYRIDPRTGHATLLGWSGFYGITGLTLCNRADATATKTSSWGKIKSMYR
jgi:hypothetical protein